jgi:hypothetical protein
VGAFETSTARSRKLIGRTYFVGDEPVQVYIECGTSGRRLEATVLVCCSAS